MRFWKIPMQLQTKLRYSSTERLPLTGVLTVGALLGILLVYMRKEFILQSTDILDENTLYSMKYAIVDSSVLFCYVLKKRLWSVLLMAVLATTYLGLAVCVGMSLWYGICGGVLIAVAVFRYGMRGILLVIVGVMPQFFVYVPAFVLLVRWCQTIYVSIYIQKNMKKGAEGKHLLPRFLLRLVGIIALFFIGCVLEGFVNPQIMLGLLKIF